MNNKGKWVELESGKKVFISEKNSGCLMADIIFIIYLIYEFMYKNRNILVNWKQYTPFNKLIAGIYYYILHIPIKLILLPWTYIYSYNLTPYKNLNLILAILNIIVFFILFIKLLFLISDMISNILPNKFNSTGVLLVIYIAPVVTWIIGHVLSWLIQWLFA